MRNIFKKLTAVIVAIGTFSVPSSGQGISNPVLKEIFDATPVSQQCSNKSFEAGTTDWQMYSGRTTGAFGGSYSSGVVPTSGCAEGTYGASCHMIESSAADGNIAGLPKVVHGGQSLRFGGNNLNSSTGYIIQGASKRFFVEPGKELYKFRFASVMQQAHDVTHGYTGTEPYFEAIAIDAATGAVIDTSIQPSSGYNLNALPDPSGAFNRYIPWTCAQLDLTGYVGKEVIVYITSADCNAGGHSSYSYIDDTCADCEVKEEPEASIDIDPQPAQCGAYGDVMVTGSYDIPDDFKQYTPTNIMVTLDAYTNGVFLSAITSGAATGGSYSFAVPRSALPDTGCIDVVATLTFNITTPSGVTRTETVTTSVEGQTEGLNNDICVDGDTCGPNCKPFTQEKAQCDASTGATIITLTNTALPDFNPNDVRIVSTTPGVTVSQNPSNPLELAVIGGTPGQVVKIKTEAIDKNGGEGKGIDLCCMGEMTITIPADQICEGPLDISVSKKWQDFIDFTGLGYTGAQVPPHGFKVTVDLPTGTLQPGDVVVVDDPLTDQVNVTGFGAPFAPAPWACSNAGNAWTCSYTVPATGAVMPVDIYWPAIIDGEKHVKNCANTYIKRAGAPVAETTMSNNQSCWEENKPIPDADLEIVKSGPLECRTGEPCVFTYTVNNTGSGDFNDSITLDDTVTVIPPSGAWGSSGGGFVSISPALCPIDDLTSGIGCSGAVSIPAGGSQVFTVTYNPPIFTGEGDFAIENCVGMLSVLQPLGDDPLESCHVTEITNPQLEIVKSGPAQCAVDQPCDFTVTINNTSQAPYSGPVLLSDMTTVSQFAVGNVSPMPAGCGGSLPANPFACVTDINLAAGASTSYTFTMVPLQSGGQVVAESGENCARLGGLPVGTPTGAHSFQYYGLGAPTVTQVLADLMQSQAPIGESCVPLIVNDPPSSDDSDVTIVKTCDPLQVNPTGPDTVQCQLTVTGTNLTPGSTITINDELFSQASPGNNEAKPVTTFLGQSNISSSEPWVCTDTSTNAPYSAGNCQISTDDLIAAGGTSVISTSSQIIAGGGLTGDLQNCAQVDTSATAGTGYTSVDPNTASCVWLSADCADGFVQQNGVCVPSVGNPNFAVTKTCGDATQIITGEPHFSWGVQCTISVTANPVPTTGTITIADVGSFTLGEMTMTSTDPWACTGTGAAESCEIAAADFPSSGTSVLTADVNVSDLLPGSSFQNCANVSNSESNLQVGSCTDVTLPTNDDVNDDAGVLNVVKTCSAQPRLGAVATFVCEIKVTATGPVTGPINLQDQLTYSSVPGGDPNGMMGQMSSNDPWACSTAPYSSTNAANCSISAADFAATGYDSSVYVVVQAIGTDLGEQDIQNCATGQSGSGVVTSPSCAVISTPTPEPTPEFNVFKECGPITEATVAENFPLSMQCVIKVQPLTPFTGTFTLNDVASNLAGGGNGAIVAWAPSDSSVTCTGAILNLNCNVDGASYPLDGQGVPTEVQIPVTMGMMDTGVPITWQNCAGGTYTFDTGTQMQVSDYCVTQSYTPGEQCVPVPEIAGDGIDNDCDGEVDELPVIANPPVLNVTKTCSDVFVDEHAQQGAVQCSITMTGNNLPSGQVITLHDAMTASNGSAIPFTGNFANVTGAPIPVNCSDTAPATGQCTISTDDFNTAQPLTLNWSTNINGNWDTGPDFENGGTLENCAHATVAPHPTVPPSTVSPQSCATINVTINEDNTTHTPLVTLPPITLEKGSTGPCSVNVAAQNYRCGFELTVTNNGPTEFNAPMVLNDVFGSPKPSSISGVDGSGWNCTTKGRDGTSCINGTLKLAPQETSKVSMQLILPGQPNGGSFGNCGAIGVGDDPVQQAMIAQTALNQIGFDVGAVDGKIGPNTRKGLQGLQKQLGLEPSGELSPAFFNAIGLQMAADAPQSCVTVELPPMPAPPLVCQASTARKKGNKCVCRYKDMYQKNKSSCGCVKGTRFVKGEGCKKVVNKPKCDRTTTVAKGNSCQCRYSNMYKKKSKTSCGCVKGTKFVKGKGCIKQRVDKPKVDKPKNKCPFGTIPLGGLCIKIKIPIGGGGGCSDPTGVDC